jgi:hypothetical protein
MGASLGAFLALSVMVSVLSTLFFTIRADCLADPCIVLGIAGICGYQIRKTVADRFHLMNLRGAGCQAGITFSERDQAVRDATLSLVETLIHCIEKFWIFGGMILMSVAGMISGIDRTTGQSRCHSSGADEDVPSGDALILVGRLFLHVTLLMVYTNEIQWLKSWIFSVAN